MLMQTIERTVLDAGGLAGALFHEAGDGLVVVSPSTERVLDANVKACELSELSRAELLQLPVRGLIRHEQEWQDWLQPVRQTITYHGKDGFLLRTRDPGRWVPVSVSISRLHPPGGEALALFTLRDRREQVEAYRRMQRTEAELRRVLVSVSDCLWSARVEEGGRWRFRYLSPVIQRLTGRPVGLFLESPAAREQAVDERDRPAWREFMARLAAGFSGELEYRVARPDGAVAWVRENVVVAPDEGGLLLHGVMTDITARKRGEMEEQAGGHHAERQRLDGLAALAGRIGHDFGNLITGILGHVSLGRMDGGGTARALEQVEALALRAADLCRLLGSFTGSGASPAAVPLRATLEQAASGGCQVEGPDGPRVLADPAAITALLARLLANAAEAGGGTALRILAEAPDRPDFSYADPGVALAWFEVRDAGHGMAPEVLARAFEPFFTTRPGRQGLGLAEALGVVRGHRGAIQVVSAPGRGTSVRVGLPAASAPAPEAKPAAAPPPAQPTVLLADDEETVLDVVSRLLSTLGYKVIPARDGEQALEAYHANAAAIRLALIDLTMPKLAGDGAVRRLRDLSASLPMVLMSGYPASEMAARFGDVPGLTFLQKPFRLPALIDLLRKVLPD